MDGYTYMHDIVGNEVFCTPLYTLLSVLSCCVNLEWVERVEIKRRKKYHKTCTPFHG